MGYVIRPVKWMEVGCMRHRTEKWTYSSRAVVFQIQIKHLELELCKSESIESED